MEGQMMKRSYNELPEAVIEVVLGYLTSNKERNAASLTCKCWYNVERLSRRKVIVENCHAITPERVMARFPRLSSLTLKGKPRSFRSDLFDHEWAGSVQPWIETLVSTGVQNFEELRLKRMLVTNHTFLLLSQSFPHSFKSLVLISCQTAASGTASSLDPIVSNCRTLRELDVQEAPGGILFPYLDSCNTLVSLNFSRLIGNVPIEFLERLVVRCPNLQSLRLNRSVTANDLSGVLVKAPRLVDLGVGSFNDDAFPETLNDALRKCTLIRSLSGFNSWMNPHLLPAIYPICHNLTSLKLHPSGIKCTDVNRLIRRCINLECLWVKGTLITDEELRILASTCKGLQELRVIENPGAPYDHRITEQGLVALSAGCPKLKKLKYICNDISNEALITVAQNCPNLVSFMLHTTWEDLGRRVEDVMAMQPLDEGFGAIVKLCKGLKRLRLCGSFTDQVFFYIGMYAEQLEVLTVDLVKVRSVVGHFAGDSSEKGILHVLNGCKKLKVLDIRNSSFGNTTLLEDVSKYERIRCLYTENCQVTLGACKQLAQEMPSLNVEIIRKKPIMRPAAGGDNDKINKMYLYRTLVGPRKDAPDSVLTL